MNLVPLSIDSIHFGQPLPFVLRGADGALLAQKGFIIRNRADLNTLLARGVQLHVDTDESGESHRAYLAGLQRMLIADTNLGEIASMKMSAAESTERDREDTGPADWPALQERATQLLRSPQPGDFGTRFQALHEELVRHSTQSPDATVLALVYLSAQETRLYSATHAMLVSCVCMIAAREVLRWPEARVLTLGRAALSMNVAMTELQDQLVQQAQPLTAAQIAAVESHAHRSEALLRQLGVADALWLEAVRNHHHRLPGPMADKTDAQQMARLIQRADIFAARLAPRIARLPMPVTAAMQASYYDEQQQVDEAGAALVKALGIYPPGAFVRLATQEIAIVLKRGPSATTPRVAVVMNRSGMPTGEMIPRNTAQPSCKITGPVAHKDVRVQLQVARLVAMV
ncbi:MAG: HD-GYP domain-containing protein [Nitrospirota bacterium]|jgi:HD-GYP domain-containing protein (c-di-GMP phosphodiesterase class II)|nr:phosphohydrolase [Burkholderiaceae bacterium]MCB1986974.1 phosphohydrolase [Burkholderiaceae bacterium]